MAVDGTKVLANASKHSAVSSQRAGELIEQLEGEIAQLLSKAEQADSTPLEEGLKIPEEIVRGQERKAKLAQGRREIEARSKAKAAAEEAEYEKKRRSVAGTRACFAESWHDRRSCRLAEAPFP